jgi:hypothetical protein
MSYALLKHQLITPVKKYLEARGFRVESFEGDTIVARGALGTVAVKLFLRESSSELFEALWEAGSSCRDLARFDEVYLAVRASTLSRLVGKKMPILREAFQEYFRVGLLRVNEEGGVDEVIKAPRRTPARDARESLEVAPTPPRKPLTPQPHEAPLEVAAVRRAAEELVAPPAAQESRAAVGVAGGETVGEGLPDFVKDNPWLVVLSRRGVKP